MWGIYLLIGAIYILGGILFEILYLLKQPIKNKDDKIIDMPIEKQNRKESHYFSKCMLISGFTLLIIGWILNFIFKDNVIIAIIYLILTPCLPIKLLNK